MSVSFLTFEFRLRGEEMRGTAGRTFAAMLQEDPGIWTEAFFWVSFSSCVSSEFQEKPGGSFWCTFSSSVCETVCVCQVCV